MFLKVGGYDYYLQKQKIRQMQGIYESDEGVISYRRGIGGGAIDGLTVSSSIARSLLSNPSFVNNMYSYNGLVNDFTVGPSGVFGVEQHYVGVGFGESFGSSDIDQSIIGYIATFGDVIFHNEAVTLFIELDVGSIDRGGQVGTTDGGDEPPSGENNTIIPGIYNDSWSNLGYQMRNLDRAFSGEYKKNPQAPIGVRVILSILPPTAFLNSIVTFSTGSDMYGRTVTSTAERYILAPIGIIDPFLPTKFVNNKFYQFFDFSNKYRAVENEIKK